MKKIIIVTIPLTQGAYEELVDALFGCGERGKDWDINSFDDHGHTRYRVRTEFVETVRDICANHNFGFKD